MEINFIANDIVYEVTEDNSYLVGFADDKNEPKEYVIVERALEFDEQDIKLGMDSYYFEYSDQSNSGYGLCSKVVIRQNEIVFSVKHKYEDDITSITVSYKDNAIEDINGKSSVSCALKPRDCAPLGLILATALLAILKFAG